MCKSKGHSQDRQNINYTCADGLEQDYQEYELPEPNSDDEWGSIPCISHVRILRTPGQMQVLSRTVKEIHPNKSLLMVELAYTTKAHTYHSKKLRMCIDTAADVNVMPVSVYRMVFQDPILKSLKSMNMTFGVYTNSEIPVLGKCTLYLRHPETKKYIPTTFYVADHEGSVLLSYRSSLELDVIRVRPRISNSAPRSTVITSKVDHSKHTKK